MIDISNLTIEQAHKDLLAKKYSARDLAQAYLDVISAKNSDINAFVEVYSDVLKQADAADAIIAAGKATKLTGIPVAVKDNILVKDNIASSASAMLKDYHSTYDATAIKRLKEAGAVLIGRTNMDEFAMGGSTEKSIYGATKNPHDTSRVPGGTSGGSAAAVAMGGTLVSLGSDTGGSVRQPASFCGIVGLKPTYGSVSRYGLMAAVSSFDQIGPMGKTVGDVKALFEIVRGQDINDGTTISTTTYPVKPLKGTKGVIGIPRELISDGIDTQVKKNFDESVEKFKALGYEIKDISVPHARYALPAYYIINFAEISSNLGRFDGVRYGLYKEGKTLIDDYVQSRTAGFGKEARRRILLGAYVLSSGYYDAYYNKANALRELIRGDYAKAFEEVDVILTPTTPAPAWKIGEKSSNPMEMYLADVFTVTPNLTGMPALSMPSGLAAVDGKQLPLGVQLVGAHGADEHLFTIAASFLGE
ncbi:MAG: Asp-tRNA(Asn)/Glu-tRNA(Gln) amidotransferase subunit GatA [Patescibacteria group bacterium]